MPALTKAGKSEPESLRGFQSTAHTQIGPHRQHNRDGAKRDKKNGAGTGVGLSNGTQAEGIEQNMGDEKYICVP